MRPVHKPLATLNQSKDQIASVIFPS